MGMKSIGAEIFEMQPGVGGGCEVAAWARSSRHLRDHNLRCGPVTERDADAIYLAEKRASPADFRDQSGFTKTQLANPLAETRIARERVDSAHSAGGKLTEWKRHV
jgi:hypothetical protein